MRHENVKILTGTEDEVLPKLKKYLGNHPNAQILSQAVTTHSPAIIGAAKATITVPPPVPPAEEGKPAPTPEPHQVEIELEPAVSDDPVLYLSVIVANVFPS